MVNRAKKIYKNNNLLKITNDPFAAVQEQMFYIQMFGHLWGKKIKKKDKDFLGFTIDKNLVRHADKDAIILHCLPA